MLKCKRIISLNLMLIYYIIMIKMNNDFLIDNDKI